jgi:hypothetical protein
MPRSSRWLVTLALALAGTLAAGACTGSDDDDQSTGDGDAIQGIPADESDAEAPGSPIDVPSFQISEGRLLDEMLPIIEDRLRELCGGDLCVEIVVEHRDDDHTECEFSDTDPPAGSQIERGGTLVVIAGTQPCDDGDSDGDDSDDGDDGDDPSGEGGDSDGDEGGSTDDGSSDTTVDGGTGEGAPSEATP